MRGRNKFSHFIFYLCPFGGHVNDVTRETIEKSFWHGYKRALEDAVFELEIREHFTEASLLRQLIKTMVRDHGTEG